MAVATKPTRSGPCLGCGEMVAPEAGFCPVCGTRQDPDRPMPVLTSPAETERLARSTNAWLLAAIVALGLLVLAVGIVGGWIGASLNGEEEGGDAGGDAAAAESMDAYVPLAEGWADKYDHVTDEAGGDDPNGLAASAEDARLWIEVNREDLGVIAAQAGGDSASLYQELVAIFDERAGLLADVEAIATAGGAGTGAAAGEVAALAELEQRADAVTCSIADVMRAEGDDPADHMTPEMGVVC